MSEDPGFESRLVRESARRYVDQRCPIPMLREHIESGSVVDLVRETWADVADLGWSAILVPEVGDGALDQGRLSVLSALAEELGAGLYPGPALSTAAVAHAVAVRGSDELRAEYLDDIASGALPAAVAIEPNEPAITAEWSPRGLTLAGSASAVPNGSDAAVLLVSARTETGPVHVLLPTELPGVHVQRLDSLDLTRPFARFDIAGVSVASHAVLAADPAAYRSTEDLVTLLACSETIGAAQRTFDFTLQYAKTRIAFGRPIGAFQVIKHRLVEMLLVLESAKAAVDSAVAELGSDSAFGRHGAAMAILYSSERLPLLARDCLQIHGGIGFTWEHDMHLYLRRIESNSVLWGGPDRWGERLATDLGLPTRLGRDPEGVR